MFSISYRVGLDKTVAAGIRKELDRRAFLCAQITLDYIRKNMATPKSGRWYTIPGTNLKYQASAPGEYPAIRTKALYDSIRIGLTSSPGRAFIGTEISYGKDLEDRTVATGGRPWLGRAMRELADEYIRIWQVPVEYKGVV